MQAQDLVKNALQSPARGVVAARERKNTFSWISLDGGGNNVDTATGAHKALSYIPLRKGQALP